ncbi:helix-turn-helix domain-containing protein [Lactobacillus sp.]|uniref:helix-turn-helix domain-containing protein n=1 Tax=Lactobacillus sp. TaxID=1591 RepID=UPI0025FCE046|nr:Rgg/GadR/MutR family transcriptional regulator [Lactobacillus sp.]MCO6532112.1 hypothetical protein [Lactobacillus sp.]
MKIGDLLKKYRLSRGKTKKAWAGDILSPSFYARVENGSNRISAEDLIDLLHANDISVVEFFGQLNPQDRLVNERRYQFLFAINEAYYQDSKADLLKIRDTICKSNLPDKSEELMILDVYLAIVDDEYDSINQETLHELKDRIFMANEFDIDTMNLYCNCMAFYDFDTNLMISSKLVKQYQGNQNSLIEKNLLGIIINMLNFCIKEQRYEEAKQFINSANQIAPKPEIYFYKNMIIFFTNIIRYHTNSDEKYLETCHDIINDINRIGMNDFSKEMAEFLQKNIK